MQKPLKVTPATESWWGPDKKKYRGFLARYFRDNVARRQECAQLVDPFVIQVVYF